MELLGAFLWKVLKRASKLKAPMSSFNSELCMENTLVGLVAVVKDFVVTDFNGKSPVELPRVYSYTGKEILADHEQIPTPSMVKRIEHLKEIALRLQL